MEPVEELRFEKVDVHRAGAVAMIPSGRLRWWYVAVLLVVVLGCAGSSSRAPAALAQEPQAASLSAQPLSPEGKASLHALIQSGSFSELYWPNFSAYRKDVAKFYESYNYALPWVRGMRPSSQAQAVITALEQADDKGLSSEPISKPMPMAIAKEIGEFGKMNILIRGSGTATIHQASG